MIPTMLIAGIIAGLLPTRWTLIAIVLLGIGWSALLFAGGVELEIDDAIEATMLSLVNATVGALASQSVRLGILFITSPR